MLTMKSQKIQVLIASRSVESFSSNHGRRLSLPSASNFSGASPSGRSPMLSGEVRAPQPSGMPISKKSDPARIAPPAPAPGLNRHREQGRKQRAADRYCGADHRHRPSTPADEPGISHSHRRVDKTRCERNRDYSKIDNEKHGVTIDRG